MRRQRNQVWKHTPNPTAVPIMSPNRCGERGFVRGGAGKLARDAVVGGLRGDAMWTRCYLFFGGGADKLCATDEEHGDASHVVSEAGIIADGSDGWQEDDIDD